ncbi:hypothetical protein ACVME8_006555 [Bradyrhizobium diazoefficiens]
MAIPGLATFDPDPFSNPALAAGLIASGLFMPRVAKSSDGNAFSTCLAYRRIRRGFVMRTATPKMSRRRGCAARAFFAGTDFMPSAIEQIVDIYVRLKNRRGLDELMMHRQRLAVDLKSRSGYDFSLPIGQIDEEIAIIEAGLSRLKAGSNDADTTRLI